MLISMILWYFVVVFGKSCKPLVVPDCFDLLQIVSSVSNRFNCFWAASRQTLDSWLAHTDKHTMKRFAPDSGFSGYELAPKFTRYDDRDSFESYDMGEPYGASEMGYSEEEAEEEPVPVFMVPPPTKQTRPGPKPQANPIFHEFYRLQQQAYQPSASGYSTPR